ncbi:MAG TPA: hypothetical protein VKX49_28745 [Bryobacteraceae bacterium]|nr:hypothetical protein [Bryobacteraceae bacterium]
MHMARAEQHAFAASLECRYLIDVPDDLCSNPLLVVALHGYSSNAEDMLRLARMAVGDEHVVASVQAPNQHYVTAALPQGRPAAGYNWGISNHWDSTVRLHHEMVLKVLAIVRERLRVGPDRCALLGFSQPVGLNYRFAATHPDQVRGIIGICGGVPRDWHEPKYKPVSAALLHISRDEDQFYPAEVASKFGDRLRERAQDVEFHMIPGPHRFPSKAAAIVRPWLNRVFGGT